MGIDVYINVVTLVVDTFEKTFEQVELIVFPTDLIGAWVFSSLTGESS